MDQKKEKTHTKTLELKNVQDKLAKLSSDGDKTGETQRHLDDVTDPTLKANRDAAKKDEVTRKALLSEIKDDNDDTGEIQFSATTKVFELDSAMRNALGSGSVSADRTVALKIPEGLSEDEAKKIKLQVKNHYIKKAQVLEAEVNKILQGFKTTNPVLQAQIDKIKVLLGKHSGRIKE
jgi:hypothetical protein